MTADRPNRIVAAVILAAGMSRRMGTHKLLLPIDGEPLVRRVVGRVAAGPVAPVIVVLGHEAALVADALAGIDVRFIVNPAYRDGMSSSLRAGLDAVPPECAGAVICLADMPDVDTALIARLVGAFEAGAGIVAPRHQGRRGNPVLWGRRHFAALKAVTGEAGGKRLLDDATDAICWVEEAQAGIFTDLDTPEMLERWRAGTLEGPHPTSPPGKVQMTPKQQRLISAYTATDYRILDGREWFSVRVGAAGPELEVFLTRENATHAVFITAWNPGSKPRPDVENRAAGARLAAHLRELKLRFMPQRAVPDSDSWDPEDGHCVLNLDADAALAIAERFGQTAIVMMRRGGMTELLYTSLMGPI